MIILGRAKALGLKKGEQGVKQEGDKKFAIKID